MQLNLAQMAESLRELHGALELFRELGDKSGQASSLDILCVASIIAGDLDGAVAYGREAIGLLQELGDRWTAASSTANVGGALGFQGVGGEGEELARQALGVWTEIGARSGESYGHLCIGFFLHPFGSFERALREAQIGLQIAREIDHNEWIVLGLGVVGQIRRACGDVAGARHLHEEMLGIARKLGANIWLAAALCELGQDLAFGGDEPRARALLDEAMVVGGDALEYTAMVMLAQAELSLRYGRPDEALTNARRVLVEAPQFRVLAVDAAIIEGAALVALGRLEEAETTLCGAKAVAGEFGTDPSRWRACLALGDLFRQTNRTNEADAECAEALALLEAMADSLSDADLRQAFEGSEPMRRARDRSGPGQVGASREKQAR
jgi:tetratricopeptide (TPR) repeat protein